MKIVHLSRHKNAGGAAQAAYQIHRALRSNGVDSRFLCTDAERSSDGEIACNLPILSKAARHLKNHFWHQRIGRSASGRGFDIVSDMFGVGWELADLIDGDADIVQINWVAGWLDWERFFRSDVTAPIVWRFSDMNPYTGGCHYSGPCNGFKDKCTDCPQVGTSAKRRIARNWKRKSEILRAVPQKRITVVVQSDWMRTQISESDLFRRFECVTIRNGVDKKLFAPVPQQLARRLLGLPEDEFLPLLFGSNSKRRGVLPLLDRWQQVGEHGPRFVLVGDANHPLVYNSRTLRVPRLEKRMLCLAYSAADLLIFPSLQDNCPNTILEAQSCGTPVIGFSNTGVQPLIRDGVNGKLIDEGRYDDLLGLVEDGRIGRLSFDRAAVRSSVRSLDEMITDYTSTYSAVLSKN